MKKIIAKNREHLNGLILQEIDKKGYSCSLNHIVVDNVRDMSALFHTSDFNGDISDWNVSQVENMSGMFHCSKFNGDISRWNVSKVKHMDGMFLTSVFEGDISMWDVSSCVNMMSMFCYSKFNGDISQWRVENVSNMNCQFYASNFTGDLTEWRPVSLHYNKNMFENCLAPPPYWSKLKTNEEIKRAVEIYTLRNELRNKIYIQHSDYKKAKL